MQPGALPFAAEGAATARVPLATFAGSFFAGRVFFVLLAVRLFQQDPQIGVAASLLLSVLLLLLALLSPARPSGMTLKQIVRQPCFFCVVLYLGLTGVSLLWSVTSSLAAAAAFWVAMAADAGILVLQVHQYQPGEVTTALFRGYVQGASLMACIAWILPAQPDMRLGDEEWLGPNQIGWLCGVAFFFAQYLIRSRCPGPWKLHAVLLALTVLRSLSKTTILALLVAQAFLLLQDDAITVAAKFRVVLVGCVSLLPFAGLFVSYFESYNNTNSPESLTGRLGIWTYIFTEGLESPILGHGFHSVWKVVPVFYGTFQPRHAHNELLQQFYCYGIAGVVLLIVTYSRIVQVIRKTPSAERTFWGSFLVFVLIRSLADTEVFDYSWPIWLLVLFGSLMACASAHTERAT